MARRKQSDGTYSCTEHGGSFPSGRPCPECIPSADSPSVAATRPLHIPVSAGGEPPASIDLIDLDPGYRHLLLARGRQLETVRIVQALDGANNQTDIKREEAKLRALRLLDGQQETESLEVRVAQLENELRHIRERTNRQETGIEPPPARVGN